MADRLRRLLLRWLRVPPAPEPPRGSAESTRVFRAARGFFHRRLLEWGVAQFGAIAGLTFGLGLTVGGFLPDFVEELAGDHIRLVEVLSITAFVAQFLVGPFILRLEYELRWYIVTDRSLRIREGIFRVREQTVSFANIQNVSVKQGPLQRLLKIADVEIRTAGGGDSSSDSGKGDHLHRAVFRGIDNANEVRDLIRRDLRRLRAEQSPEATTPELPRADSLTIAARRFADAAAEARAALAGS